MKGYIRQDLPSIRGTVALGEHKEIYDGDYEVTPDTKDDQVLATRLKYMAQDLTVKQIPYAAVTNPSGGITVTIG